MVLGPALVAMLPFASGHGVGHRTAICNHNAVSTDPIHPENRNAEAMAAEGMPKGLICATWCMRWRGACCSDSARVSVWALQLGKGRLRPHLRHAMTSMPAR